MAKNDDIQALATYIAVRHGIKLSEAQHFITKLFELIGEALRTDRMVKVKGLGTFKVIDVKERESVDVNTGKRIVIEGRDKITFTPDTVMKDLVNKPFAQFETVVLNDGVDFSDIDTADTAANDALSDSAIDVDSETEPVATPTDTTAHDAKEALVPEPAQASSAQADAVEDTLDAEVTPAGTATQAEEISRKPATDTKAQEYDEPASPTEEPVTTAADAKITATKSNDTESITPGGDEPEPDDDDEEEADESDDAPHSFSWIWKLAVCVVLVAASYLIGYNVGKQARQQQMIDEALAQTDTAAATQPDTTAEASVIATEKEITMSDLDADSSQTATPATEQPQPAAKSKPTTPSYAEPRESDSPRLAQARTMVRMGAYVITGTQETITVPAGKTLKQLSKYYFGEGMECYILVHNNIDDISEGMQLKIPKLEYKKKAK